MQQVRTAFWLAVLAAIVAVTDAVLTALGRARFTADVDELGWAINENAPYDGTRQRFVFCLVVALVVAVAALAAAALVTRPRPASRLGILVALPLSVLLDLFTVVYAPDGVGTGGRGAKPEDLAETEAAFDRLFPLWYTGGHTTAVVALGALTVAMVLKLRKPAVMEYFEFEDAESLRAGLFSGRTGA
ncbi:hypothetical protein ABZS66_07465 [Dactylosporangium sp. NPDC005572]|uniref:hypothetical protein n=1 Tax=Dactylosporangium sp. NPDC005572 TaxID=3156889 RepID=UPI0033B0F7D7